MYGTYELEIIKHWRLPNFWFYKLVTIVGIFIKLRPISVMIFVSSAKFVQMKANVWFVLTKEDLTVEVHEKTL